MGLIDRIVEAAKRDGNVAAVVNTGKGGGSASATSRQRIVQRDGKTTVITEHTETREVTERDREA